MKNDFDRERGDNIITIILLVLSAIYFLLGVLFAFYSLAAFCIMFTVSLVLVFFPVVKFARNDRRFVKVFYIVFTSILFMVLISTALVLSELSK